MRAKHKIFSINQNLFLPVISFSFNTMIPAVLSLGEELVILSFSNVQFLCHTLAVSELSFPFRHFLVGGQKKDSRY